MKRLLTSLLLSLLTIITLPAAALADCAPGTPAEQAARAAAVVYGRVTEVDQRSDESYYTVQVLEVYKGTPKEPLIIHSVSGHTVRFAEDYTMAQGEAHTLYLRVGENRFYTIAACSGSHTGPASAEERKTIQASPPYTGPEPMDPVPVSPFRVWVPVIAIGLTATAMGAVLWSIRRKQR